jgi:hypothetical protein
VLKDREFNLMVTSDTSKSRDCIFASRLAFEGDRSVCYCDGYSGLAKVLRITSRRRVT